MTAAKRIPVILDTDIGNDIDDTWALAMMLNCPELDVQMVISDQGDTLYRAKIIAKMLEAAKRTDVDVGVGVRQPMKAKDKRQLSWVKGYDLRRYPGRVHKDGVAAMIERIMTSTEPVTLICIGPVPNILEALQREPRIARKARFVGMHGSVREGMTAGSAPIAEYNVVCDVPACQAAFKASWDKVITPLDTCSRVRLTGRHFAAVAKSKAPLARAVMANYKIWQKSGGWIQETDASSVLFDCVAVHLAYSTRFLRMRRMGLRVTDTGFTVPDARGSKVNVALAWKDLAGFEDFLVRRITQGDVC